MTFKLRLEWHERARRVRAFLAQAQARSWERNDLGLCEEQESLYDWSTSEGEEDEVGLENVADERWPPSLWDASPREMGLFPLPMNLDSIPIVLNPRVWQKWCWASSEPRLYNDSYLCLSPLVALNWCEKAGHLLERPPGLHTWRGWGPAFQLLSLTRSQTSERNHLRSA